jgi:hypothetical protein
MATMDGSIVSRMPSNIWRGKVRWLGPPMKSATTISSKKRNREGCGSYLAHTAQHLELPDSGQLGERLIVL